MSSFFSRAYGNSVVLASSFGQRKAPYLTPEKLAAHRDARLREIVPYAARTVPHYRDLFESLRIDPGQIRTAGDLSNLPLVTKSEISKAPDRFISDSRRGHLAVTFETSGTTGLRLRIDHDRRSLLANIAYSERERTVLSHATGKLTGYRELVLGYTGNTRSKVSAFYRAHTFLPIRPSRRIVTVDQPFETVVQAINDFRPDVLVGYGSYLEAFYRLVTAFSVSLHRPQLILYGAEAMSPEGQRFIEQEIGIPVHSQYNAVEAFKIGFTCEANRGFHLHDDLCHLRIIDSQGHDVGVGEVGEIVISNLVNHGTVLLNYRLGDRGRLSDDACPCGRTLPLLQDLQGRVEEVIYLSEDHFVAPRAVWGVLKSVPEILRYQLIQHQRNHFELRLMTTDEAGYDEALRQALVPLGRLLGSAVIDPVRVADLDLRESRKFRPVIALERPV
jgi:phenylacetate-CoA ligase